MVFTIREGEVTSLSGSGSDTLVIDIPDAVTFTISKLKVKYTGNFKITKIHETGGKTDFLSGALYETHFSDDDGKSLTLDPKMVIKGPCKLRFSVTDTSGSTNNIYIAAIGDEK